jgi:hypothetical protein
VTIKKNRRPFLFSFLFTVLCYLLLWFSPYAQADPGDTTLCLLKDNKKAAVTFVFDDGFYDVVHDVYLPEFREHGLKGTAALVTEAIEESTGIQPFGLLQDPLLFTWATWTDWNTILAEGYIDVANHSYSHPDLRNVNPTRLEREVNGSKAILDSHLANYQTICFIYPYNHHNETIRAKAAEKHYAARGGQIGYNSLSPTQEQFFQLLQQDVLMETTNSEMNGWVDTAMAQGSWLIEMWHDCDNLSNWWPEGSPPCAVIRDHLGYVGSKLTEIWNGTFPEVTKYIRQRMAGQVILKALEAKRIILDLTDTLDDTIFDFPLTLKTELPGSFVLDKPVRVIQHGRTRLVQPVQEDGTPYVYYEAIPDRGFIQILSPDYPWRSYFPLIQTGL